jgi:hypothetical protein
MLEESKSIFNYPGYFFILVDHRTTFISSKTPGTSKDETNPVDESLRANGR